MNAGLSTPDAILFLEYIIFYSECSTDTLNLIMLFPDNLANVMSYSLQIREAWCG